MEFLTRLPCFAKRQCGSYAESFCSHVPSVWYSDIKSRQGVSVVSVSLRPGESQEQLLKRWRKQVAKSGILKSVRRKRWYVSKSEKRRLAKARAIRKARRKSNRSSRRRRGNR